MIFQALAHHGALLRAPRAFNHPVCKVEVQGFLPIELPPLPSGQTLKLVQEAEGGGASAAEIADASGVWSAEDASTWRRIAEYVEDELADTLSVGGRLWPSAAALCRWMRGEASLRGARVLELGCGTGACGLYAAHCGAAVGAAEVLLEPRVQRARGVGVAEGHFARRAYSCSPTENASLSTPGG